MLIRTVLTTHHHGVNYQLTHLWSHLTFIVAHTEKFYNHKSK
ncbi:MAG: hypothetical protein RM338_02340 [Nostoc sp. DedQUE12a]|nr:hypothetical protein [Nostoc sp. DedQUE12a]